MITDPPPTTSITLQKKICIFLLFDGQVTGDMGHITHDRWKEVNLLSKFQLPSFYALGVTGDI